MFCNAPFSVFTKGVRCKNWLKEYKPSRVSSYIFRNFILSVSIYRVYNCAATRILLNINNITINTWLCYLSWLSLSNSLSHLRVTLQTSLDEHFKSYNFVSVSILKNRYTVMEYFCIILRRRLLIMHSVRYVVVFDVLAIHANSRRPGTSLKS